MSVLDKKLCNLLAQDHYSISISSSHAGHIMLNNYCCSDILCKFENVAFDTLSYVVQRSAFRNTIIGRYCSLASKLKIGVPKHKSCANFNTSLFSNEYDHDFDFAFSLNPSSESAVEQESQGLHHEPLDVVEIGHDVWIGESVTITEGVKVGTGSVIGTASVITKDVPPYAIVVGQDRHLRNRFPDELISDLLESHWWDYDLPAMSLNGVNFDFANPSSVIQMLKDLDPEQLIPVPQNWISFDVPEQQEPVTNLEINKITFSYVQKFFAELRAKAQSHG